MVKDLDVLLGWHQVKGTNGWKKEKKLDEWQGIVGLLKPPPHNTIGGQRGGGTAATNLVGE